MAASSTCPVIVGNEYCHDKEVEYVMKQEWWVISGGFTVTDTSGNSVFQVKNSALGHQLLDMSGRTVGELVQKKLAPRITFHIYSGLDTNERKATLNLRIWKFKKKAHVYIYDAPYSTRDDATNLGDMKPTIIIESETFHSMWKLLKEVKIYNRETGEEYARMSKTSWKNYVLKVKPGVDSAFMCLCAVFFNSAVKVE